MKIHNLVNLLLLALFVSCEKSDQDTCSKYPDRQPDEMKKLVIEISQDGEKIVDFSYDSLNRITKRIYYDKNMEYFSQVYIYDSVGRLDSILKFYSSYTQTEKFIYGSDQRIYTAIENLSGSDEIIKEIIYDRCRIQKVTVTGSNWYTTYSYDIRGNTTDIINYLDGQMINRTNYDYDNRINPLRYQITDPYLIQNNNVTYMYHENFSEWFPLEVFSSFEYDDDGFPVRETRTIGQAADSVIFTYRYDE